ncbi:MAG TPA: septation protein A [Gammaproteobacteria bacterium]|jgi:intracellular septation protein|nr:septation protein A [Gammaproteobacteria bacterium]
MSSLLEFLLLAAFFLSYLWKGIYAATAVIMVGSVLLLVISWWRTRRLEPMPLMVAVLAVTLGGVTLVLHDPVYIKWKFSVIEWSLGLVLLGSQFFGSKNFIRRALETKLVLPDGVWRNLNFMWAGFFLFLGTLNVYIIYNFSTDGWVRFKLFGSMGLTLIFIVAQAVYLAKHMPTEEKR